MASYTQGKTLHALPVELAMSRGIKVCSVDDSISRVLEIMGEARVRRVPVIQAGSVVGIVALADIARWVNAQRVSRGAACEALAKALAAVSEAPAGNAAESAQAAE
jgi:predicted transcriptional regulator